MIVPKPRLAIFFVAVLTLLNLLLSCDDNTGNIGANALPSTEQSSSSQALFNASSSSYRVDSLVANTSDCYLGRVTDPETGATTTCNFLAQFYNLEDYALPARDSMHQVNGQVIADSVDLHLYINSYYGDSLNSMKIGVYELDPSNVMEETSSYFTNLNPDIYVNHSSDALRKEISFSVVDLTISDSLRYSSSYSKNIRIKLPASFGTKILNKYYEHPEFFRNSYYFIRNVLPGFYFKVLSGNGTMVNVDISTMNIYFNYKSGDSTYVGVQRVAATSEVLQNNVIEHKGISTMLNDTECTYLKTPAGIFTQIELPIDSIYLHHEQDSVNSAKLVLRRLNNEVVTKYSLSTPSQILIIQKDKLNDFFANHQVPDGKVTLVSAFSSAYNSYTFDNIAPLIAVIRNTRNQGAGVTTGATDAFSLGKIAAWESAHPDWNKVVLVPVKVSTNTMGVITKCYHDFDLTSTKLVGGPNKPISMTIVYSHFN